MLRLFLFHCAGGSHILFRGWQLLFPREWELCTVEAPGRGRLADYPLATSMDELAAFLLPAMSPLLDVPFAMFGHSMGGMVAYDLTRRLAAAGQPQPVWVGVSARRAPDRTPDDPNMLRHTLSNEDLRRGLLKMGGTPPAVLEHPELWAMIAPILRADLCLSETWQPPPGPPFPAPRLSAFGGTEDRAATLEQLAAWRRYTACFVGLRQFPGGHFYFQNCLPELACRVVADVMQDFQSGRLAVPDASRA
jgi:surfactin synthase thioesterase subunit